jgi:hypothetical protein
VNWNLPPELGKDAFHRVPDFARNDWDAVERVLTRTSPQSASKSRYRSGRSAVLTQALAGILCGNLLRCMLLQTVMLKVACCNLRFANLSGWVFIYTDAGG